METGSNTVGATGATGRPYLFPQGDSEVTPVRREWPGPGPGCESGQTVVQWGHPCT